MSTYDTRKRNLRLLIDKWGGTVSLAKRLGHANASYLSQMTGRSAARRISEKTARKIESELDLKPGWLDAEKHEIPVTQEGGRTDVDVTRLSECVTVVSELCEAQGLTLNARKFSDLVALVYQDNRPPREQTTYLTRILKLMG